MIFFSGAVLGIGMFSWIAFGKPSELPAAGGTPNALLAELASQGGEPHVFKEDAEAVSEANQTGDSTQLGNVVPRTYNPNCWAASLDVSGISWHKPFTCPIITRRHIVTAAHRSGLPRKLNFQTRQGERISVDLILVKPENYPNFKPTRQNKENYHGCWIDIGNDIAVATTAKALPEELPRYPLPTPLGDNRRDALVGRTVLSTSWSSDNHQPDPKGLRLLGLRKIARFSRARVGFSRDRDLPAGLYFNAVIGDSGNPLFFVDPSSGSLILVSTFTHGGGGAGPFYGDPGIQKNLREYIAASPAADEPFTTFDLGSEN